LAKGGLLDAKGLRDTIQGVNPGVIYHMGARTDLDGRSQLDYSANTIGVENLIAAIDDLKSLRRVVFASSRLVCRIGYQPSSDQDYCPTTLYGESKVQGEQIVRSSSNRIPCPWVIVRPTSIWGPWFDVPYKTFFLAIAKGRYVHPGQAEIFKSFGFIGNTVYELQRLQVAQAESVNEKTLYLADYPPIDVAKMVNSIQKELGVVGVIIFLTVIWWWVRTEGTVRKNVNIQVTSAMPLLSALMFVFIASTVIRTIGYFNGGLLIFVTAAAGVAKLNSKVRK
jgi:nucleoside-diphosphate-sugar epimerase